MSELTTDQKIEQLVLSVLSAVDTRLNEVRDEMHTLAEDVERRHHAVLLHFQELENRIEHGPTEAALSGGDPLAARMEQATQVLLERIEAMQQRNTIATNERFASLSAAIEQLRGTSATPVAPLLPGLDEMSAPLRVSRPATATGPIPVLSPIVEPSPTLADIPAPAHAVDAVIEPAPAASESIDLNQLADLLSERLGQLSLPPRQP